MKSLIHFISFSLFRIHTQLNTSSPRSMGNSQQTNEGALIIYDVQVNDDTNSGLYTQNDSPFNYLRRDSAELFIKETIPSLKLNVVKSWLIRGRIN